MDELTFEKIYEKLSKFDDNDKTSMLEDKIVEKILKADPEYKKIKKETIQNNQDEVQKKFAEIEGINFGIYMFKTQYTDFHITADYEIVNNPETKYYEAGMVMTKYADDGKYSIDNLFAVRNSDREIVQLRYNYLSYILDNYSLQEILTLVDKLISSQKR